MSLVAGTHSRRAQFSSAKSMPSSNPVVFSGVAPAVSKTFFEFLFNQGIIDPKGNLKEECIFEGLPILDNISRNNLSNYMHNSLVQNNDLSLVVFLYEVREYCRVNALPMRICMVGSACYYFLETYIPIVMQRCLHIERGQYDRFLDHSRTFPADVDFRIDIPGASQAQLIELANLMIQFLASKIGVSQEQVKVDYVRNYKYIGNKQLSYFILSFEFPGEPNPKKIDFNFVSYNPRTHLFTDQNFNVQFNPFTFKPDSAVGSVQAVVDRLDGVIHIENPSEVNFLGWFSLLSSWTKGRCSMSLSECNAIWKAVDYSDWAKIANRLRNTAINHHPNYESDAFVALAMNACSFFKRKEEDEMATTFIPHLMRAVISMESLSFSIPFDPQNPILNAVLCGARSEIPYLILNDILLLTGLATYGSDRRIIYIDERPVMVMKTGPLCHLHLDARMGENSLEKQLAYYESLPKDNQIVFSKSAVDYLEKIYQTHSAITDAKEIEPFLQKLFKDVAALEGKDLPIFLQMQIYELYLLDYARAPSQRKLILILKTLHFLMKELSDRKPMLERLLLWTQKAIEEGEKPKEKKRPSVNLKQIQLDSPSPSERELSFVRMLLQSEVEPLRILSSEVCLQLPIESIALVFPEYLKIDFRLAMHIFAQIARDQNSPLNDSLLLFFDCISEQLMKRDEEFFTASQEVPEYLALPFLVSILERITSAHRSYLDRIQPKFLLWLSHRGYQKEAFGILEVLHEEGRISSETATILVAFWIRVAKSALDAGNMEDALKVFKMWYSFQKHPCWPCHENCTFSEGSRRSFLELFFALHENGSCPEIFEELTHTQSILYLVTSIDYPLTERGMQYISRLYSVGIAKLGSSSTWKEDYVRLKAGRLSEPSALYLEVSYLCRCLEERVSVEFSRIVDTLSKASPLDRTTYLKQVVASLFKNRNKLPLDLVEKIIVRFQSDLDDDLLRMLWEAVKPGIGNKQYSSIFSRLVPALLASPSVFSTVVETFTGADIPKNKGELLFASSSPPNERQALFQEVVGKLVQDSRVESRLVLAAIIQRFHEEFSEDTLLLLHKELKRELKNKKEEYIPVFVQALPRFVSTPRLYIETIVDFTEKEFASLPRLQESLRSQDVLIHPLQRMQTDKNVTIQTVLKRFLQDFSKERCDLAEKIVGNFSEELDPVLLRAFMDEIRKGIQERKAEKLYLSACSFMMPHFLSSESLFVEAFVSFTARDFPAQIKVQEILAASHANMKPVGRDAAIVQILEAYSKNLSKERLDLAAMLIKFAGTLPNSSLLLQQIKEGVKDKKESKNTMAFFALLLPQFLSSHDAFVDAAMFLTENISQPKLKEVVPVCPRIVDSLNRVQRGPILKDLLQKFLENPTKERNEVVEKVIETFQTELTEEILEYMLQKLKASLPEKKGEKFLTTIFSMLLSRFLDSSSLFLPALEILSSLFADQAPDPKVKSMLLLREKEISEHLIKEGLMDRLTELLHIGLLTYGVLEGVAESVLRKVFKVAQTRGYLSLACYLDAKFSVQGEQREEERFAFAKTLVDKEGAAYVDAVVSVYMSGTDTKKYRPQVEEYCRFLLSLSIDEDLKGEYTKYEKAHRSERPLAEMAWDMMEKYSIYSSDMLYLFYRHANMSVNQALRQRAFPNIMSLDSAKDPAFYSDPRFYLEALAFFANCNEAHLLQNWLEDSSFERRVQSSIGKEIWEKMLASIKNLPCALEQYQKLEKGVHLLPEVHRMNATIQMLSLGMANENLQSEVCKRLDEIFKMDDFGTKKPPSELLAVALQCFKDERIRTIWTKWKSLYIQIFQYLLQNWSGVKKNVWSDYLSIHSNLTVDPDIDGLEEMALNIAILKWLEEFSDKRKNFHPFSMLLEVLLDRPRLVSNEEKFKRLVHLLDSSSYLAKDERSIHCTKFIENQIIPYVRGRSSEFASREYYLTQGLTLLCQVEGDNARSRVATRLVDAMLDVNAVDFDLLLQIRECQTQLLGRQIDFKDIYYEMPDSEKAQLLPVALNPKRKDAKLFYIISKHIVERLITEDLPRDSRAEILNDIVFTLYGSMMEVSPSKAMELTILGSKVIFNRHAMFSEDALKVFMFGLIHLRGKADGLVKITSGQDKKTWAAFNIKLNIVERVFWVVKLGKDNSNPLDFQEFHTNRAYAILVLDEFLQSSDLKHIYYAAAFIGIAAGLYRSANRAIPDELILKVRDIMIKVSSIDYFVLMIVPLIDQEVPFIEAIVQSLMLPVTAREEHARSSIIHICNVTAASMKEINGKSFADLTEKRKMLGCLKGWCEGIMFRSSSHIDSDTFYKAFIPCLEELILFFDKTCSKEWDLRILRYFKQISNVIYMQHETQFKESGFSSSIQAQYASLVIKFKACLHKYVSNHEGKLELTREYHGDPEQDEKFPPIEVTLTEIEAFQFIEIFMDGKTHPHLQFTGKALIRYDAPFMLYNTPRMGNSPEAIAMRMRLLRALKETVDS